MTDAPNPREVTAPRWSAIVPVKSPGNGKSRVIATSHGRFAAGPIALAFALDTIEAVVACELVDAVFVISDDETLGQDMSVVNATLLLESPAVRSLIGHDRLNAAIRQADHTIRGDAPGHSTFAITSDLPALRTAELAEVLSEAASLPASNGSLAYLADAAGTGTSLVTAGPGRILVPMFGPDSAAIHQQHGLQALGTVAPTVRGDIDTYDDLINALQCGVGPRTARIVALAAD